MAVVYIPEGAKLSYDAEEIDALLTKINGIKNAKRNFIINPWMQVNQRGKSAYAASATTKAMDCWQLYKVDASQNADGSWNIKNPYGANGNFGQNLEIAPDLAGKTLTYSVHMKIISNPADIRLTWRTSGGANSLLLNIPAGTIGDRYFSVTFTAQNNYAGYGIYLPTTSAADVPEIDFISAKLEYGSVSTLADDEKPNYSDDLLMCQRYLYVLSSFLNNNAIQATGMCTSATRGRFAIKTPTEMRATPSVEVEGEQFFSVVSDGAIHAVTGVSVSGKRGNLVLLNCDTSGLTVNSIAGMRLVGYSGADGHLVFSAEI